MASSGPSLQLNELAEVARAALPPAVPPPPAVAMEEDADDAGDGGVGDSSGDQALQNGSPSRWNDSPTASTCPSADHDRLPVASATTSAAASAVVTADDEEDAASGIAGTTIFGPSRLLLTGSRTASTAGEVVALEEDVIDSSTMDPAAVLASLADSGRKQRRNAVTTYKGISLEGMKRRWKVRVKLPSTGKYVHIAYFPVARQMEAARLWDLVMLQLYTVSCLKTLNFPELAMRALGVPSDVDVETFLQEEELCAAASDKLKLYISAAPKAPETGICCDLIDEETMPAELDAHFASDTARARPIKRFSVTMEEPVARVPVAASQVDMSHELTDALLLAAGVMRRDARRPSRYEDNAAEERKAQEQVGLKGSDTWKKRKRARTQRAAGAVAGSSDAVQQSYIRVRMKVENIDGTVHAYPQRMQLAQGWDVPVVSTQPTYPSYSSVGPRRDALLRAMYPQHLEDDAYVASVRAAMSRTSYAAPPRMAAHQHPAPQHGSWSDAGALGRPDSRIYASAHTLHAMRALSSAPDGEEGSVGSLKMNLSGAVLTAAAAQAAADMQTSPGMTLNLASPVPFPSVVTGGLGAGSYLVPAVNTSYAAAPASPSSVPGLHQQWLQQQQQMHIQQFHQQAAAAAAAYFAYRMPATFPMPTAPRPPVDDRLASPTGTMLAPGDMRASFLFDGGRTGVPRPPVPHASTADAAQLFPQQHVGIDATGVPVGYAATPGRHDSTRPSSVGMGAQPSDGASTTGSEKTSLSGRLLVNAVPTPRVYPRPVASRRIGEERAAAAVPSSARARSGAPRSSATTAVEHSADEQPARVSRPSSYARSAAREVIQRAREAVESGDIAPAIPQSGFSSSLWDS